MSKSDRERASRLRRRRKDGATLSDADARWLARYEDERRPSRPTPARKRAEAQPAPADATPATPRAAPEMVEIPDDEPAATPAATPGATPQPIGATGNNVAPGAGNAGGNAGPYAGPGGPLPHAQPCPVGPTCPGCRGTTKREALACTTTGERFYPELSDAAARGFAGLLLAIFGIGVRMYARWVRGRELEPVEPSALEREELAEALRAVFRMRPALGWIGASFGDVAAVLGVAQSYARRSLAAPVVQTTPATVGA